MNIMTPFGYIYITTNLVNGKQYIGKRQSPMFQPGYYGSGTILRCAIAKHGIDNFKVEVVQWCYSKEDLCAAEVAWIDKYNATKSDKYYNIAAGGHGGNTYAGKTEAELAIIGAKIAERASEHNSNHGQYVGKANSMHGKRQSRSARQRIVNSSKNMHKTGHAWTAEMNAKRQHTLQNFTVLWTISDKHGNILYQYVGSHSSWLKIIFADITKCMSRIDWLDLMLYCQVAIRNIVIKRGIIANSRISEQLHNMLRDIHAAYKKDLRMFRQGRSVTTIESILHSFEVAEEASRVGDIRSAGATE
jgi:group I intron endonuclease